MHGCRLEQVNEMTAKQMTRGEEDIETLARESGIPPKGKIGASKEELSALLIGAVVFLIIVAAFLWSAMR